MAPRWSPDGAQMVPRWSPDDPQMAPTVSQEQCPGGPQMVPRWCPDDPRVVKAVLLISRPMTAVAGELSDSLSRFGRHEPGSCRLA